MYRKNAVNVLVWICISIVLLAFVFVIVKAPVLHDDISFREDGKSDVISAIRDSLNYGNGRFGGNFSIYYLMQHDILRVAIKSAVAIMMFILSALLIDKNKSVFVLSLFLYLTVDISIFRQVYVSSAAYFNYVIPIFLLVATLYLIEKSTFQRGICCLIFIFGFSMQLFAEHNTIINCCVALSMLLHKSFFDKKSEKKKEIVFFSASVLGAGIMFLMPRILGVDGKMDAYRYFPISNISDLISVCCDNVYTITTSFLQNVVLLAVLTLLCIVLMKKNGRISILLTVPLILATLVGLVLRFTDLFISFEGIFAVAFFVFICLTYCFSVFMTVLKYVLENNIRNRILGDIVFALISFGVLIPVFPIGTRCLFLGYSLLVIATLRIFRYILTDKEMKTVSVFLSIVLAIFMVFLGYVYYLGRVVDDERMEYLSEKLLAQETEITMPILPYSNFFANCGYSYVFDSYYYINTPNDVKYQFIPYDEWVKIQE